MVTEPRVYHYVRRNETTRLPRRHIVLDAGARTVRTAWGHERTWRVGVAWFLNSPKGRPAKESQSVYETPQALWEAVSVHCGKGARTVLWAHNLGYQARIGEVFTTLPQLGWRLVAHNLAPRGCWLVWRNGEASLTMVDVASVWPTTITEIGKMFGLGHPVAPLDGGPGPSHVAYAEANVRIIRTAVQSYLDWIQDADLGNWQLTGAGQSWAAYRHRFMSHQLLVHADKDAMEAERRAMWTGRCEAYWHGTILKQVIHEWDLSTAYARVARDTSVPTRLIGPLPPRADWQAYARDPRYAVLAECTIQTETPTVPASHDDHILWPVGRFTSTLWDVEILEAIADGATVTVHKGWLYRAEPALREWADWVITSLEAPDDVVPAWRKSIFKHWSRALIGRFSMQYTTWDEWGSMPTMAADRRTVIDEVENEIYDIMHIGQQVFREAGTEEWSNSMPAVTGYVMAVCRVRLWRIKKQLPEGSVLYVDTDSLLATDLWAKQIGALARSGDGFGLRLKKSWTGFTILGPRQIVTGERVRMGGIPVRSTRTGRQEFEGEVYESVDVALRHGRAGVVRAVDRTWHTTGQDRRRSGPSVGWTAPIRLDAG